jgi:hypothetical protein
MTYFLNEQDINDIAIGAAFLGSGGGGSPKMAEIMLKQVLKKNSAISVITFDELADNATVVAVGAMGAPTVLAERFFSQEEGIIAIQQLEAMLQKKIAHLIPLEIGGLNGLYAIYLAAQTQKTIIDGDCMGRAFPGIHMVTPHVYNQINPCLAVLTNANTQHVITANNMLELELQARQCTTAMGGIATIAYLPMTGKQAREYCIANSITAAKTLGKYLQHNSAEHVNIISDNLLTETNYGPMEFIMNGRIIELERNFAEGFNKGWLIIQANDNQRKIKIDFQNENLRITDLNAAKVIAIVPEIISLIDNEFKPVSCEYLRVGLEVAVVTLQVPPILRTPAALATFGPAAFNMQDEKIVYNQQEEFTN